MAESFESEETRGDTVENLLSAKRPDLDLDRYHSILELTRNFESSENRLPMSNRHPFFHRRSSVNLEEIGESYQSLHSSALEHSRTAGEENNNF